ncbi:alpha-ketoglutarate-dependent dioxygenase AlkB family protein [Vibrio viridaestus]|uniref:Alpha-ketoglutarate-dependent dioxygenase AlkB n=1 Tax=Vibrio viridaestus TaxID=2487322 RepID=A0A3N9TI48_9VIBR|nr:alpha-ketoglutarate-dependent dioxygenase AlkB [Vibrio viridaestus]RQW63205.1 alpha-ketoglutarate-dependent dioxygenase AlkB [Vibrio viridaestus]
MQRIELLDGYLDYQEEWIEDPLNLLASIKRDLDWQQGQITLFGKQHNIPRLQCWYGEKAYTYSNTTLPAKQFAPLLRPILDRVNSFCDKQFNSVLGNWYQHGKHSMGFHADNEPELGKNPIVAMITLGKSRPLLFRHNNGIDKFSISPCSGSLLIMGGQIQHFWKHGLNKSQRDMDDRITLTFRTILT